jgi:hypothetical protein
VHEHNHPGELNNNVTQQLSLEYEAKRCPRGQLFVARERTALKVVLADVSNSVRLAAEYSSSLQILTFVSSDDIAMTLKLRR